MQIFHDNNWSTRTTTLYVLLFVYIHYTSCYEITKCDITDSFSTPYISAYTSTLENGRGCELNSSMEGQEVHIITVELPDNHSDDDGGNNDGNGNLEDAEDNKNKDARNQRKPVVLLSIRSWTFADNQDKEEVGFRENANSLVFVLQASVPVKWKVELRGIPQSRDKHKFVIARDSSIKFRRKRTKFLVKNRKKELPLLDEAENTIEWAERRFGGVTSYSRLTSSNIQFYIGRDKNTTSGCELEALNLSRRAFSTHQTSQPITGCMSKTTNHVLSKDVYVLELLEAPPSTIGQQNIDLEILFGEHTEPGQARNKGTLRSMDETSRSFALVIKSPPSVQWNLRSRDIKGFAEIVSDADYDTDNLGISTTMSMHEVIESSGSDLVAWTQQYIAPVQMYAGIRAANKIKLWIPPLDDNKETLHQDIKRKGKQIRKPDLSNNGNTNKKGEMSGMIQTTCADGRTMRVVISKQFIQMTKLDKSKISLRDPSCGQTEETEQEIVLVTSLNDCGTQELTMDDVVSYSNAVIIRAPPGMVNSLLEDELGSEFFEDLEGSGTTLSDPLTDDEDLRSEPVSLAVECKLPLSHLIKKKLRKKTASLFRKKATSIFGSPFKCSISLYTSYFFVRPVISYPEPVTRDRKLIFQASLTNKDSTMLVNDCWFSTSTNPRDPTVEKSYVISQGCGNRGIHINWLDDYLDAPIGTNLPKTKFELPIPVWLHETTPFYFHCDFRLCSRADETSARKCSIDEKERCDQYIPPSIAVHRLKSGESCGPLTIGPFVNKDKSVARTKINIHPSTGKIKCQNGKDKIECSDKKDRQQKVIIEGLDTQTVVGIAFATFAIGILLTSTLWFIHSHTGDFHCCPIKRGASEPDQEMEVNEEFPPNSTTPIST